MDTVPIKFSTILGESIVSVKATYNGEHCCLASGEEMRARKIQIVSFLTKVLMGEFAASPEESEYILRTLSIESDCGLECLLEIATNQLQAYPK